MKKILIRGVNWLGDAVMSLPAIKILRQAFPDAQLDVLTPEKIGGLYEFVPEISRIHTFSKEPFWKGMKDRFKLARNLKKEKYESCFIFPNSFDSALVPSLAGIPERIGFNTQGRGWLLTIKVRPPEDYFKEHHSLHYFSIIQSVLKERMNPESVFSFSPLLILDENRKKQSMAKLKTEVPDAEHRHFIGMAPGAEYGPAKKWPLEKYRELCLRVLEENPALSILVFGTKQDDEAGKILETTHASVFDLTGKTNLAEFIGMLSLCRGVVTNDSGAMHMSGALGIPVIAIFGSTNPEATRGLGPVEAVCHFLPCSPCFDRICKKGDTACLNGITVEEVWKKMNKWIH
ncbi:MAG: lipopolysaccharide heptosyltransferase II [Candidatus Aureabacteria bacterium]|nr:lipopolysaccharide heptosyltransferase II [Candidatus Auribacterota bacterium]